MGGINRTRLSLDEARRIALAAQGFQHPRPGRRVSHRDIAAVIRRLGLIQLDFVNVLAPAHYMVLFSRLGPYKRGLLDDAVYRRREFTEQWAHEASIVPMEDWPLLRHRMTAHRVRPYGFEKFLEQNANYCEQVLKDVADHGPLIPEQLGVPDGVDRRLPGTWVGTVTRATLEAHFGRGLLAIADRRPSFQRVYDLAERIIPSEQFKLMVEPDEAQRQLMLNAARACGVATLADLADYYRMSVRKARPRIDELESDGKLVQVEVEGWRERTYLYPKATLPSKVNAAALLAPFDPLIWYRRRAARLFDFLYSNEMFVPQEKRKWGYYVLPFLLGDRLVAKVDLRADRSGKRLMVVASYIEKGGEPEAVCEALGSELRTLAAWLGLESVVVERRGNLARALAAAYK
jgi:uncharacterized protein YcaQ